MFRAECHEEGFYRHLRERDYRVALGGKLVRAYAWITTHATFESQGVEAEHLAETMKALELAARYRPEPRERILAPAREGYRSFADLLRDFFVNAALECDAAADGRQQAA